jgi:hypothetical protein
MGKQGPKFTDAYCPNQDCNLFGIAGKEKTL